MTRVAHFILIVSLSDTYQYRWETKHLLVVVYVFAVAV